MENGTNFATIYGYWICLQIEQLLFINYFMVVYILKQI